MKRMALAGVLVAMVVGGFRVMETPGGFAELSDAGALRDELMQADRDFDKTTQAKGLDGWMEFMAEDAVRLSPMGAKAFQGKLAVRTLDAKLFAEPGTRLRWEPLDGGVFEGGKLGFTTGKGRSVQKMADGTEKVLWSGVYVTIWRKEPGGKWKVILDTGASEEK